MLFSDAPDLLEEFKDFSPVTLRLAGVASQRNGLRNPPLDTQQANTPANSASWMKKRVTDKEIPRKAAPSRVRCLEICGCFPERKLIPGDEEAKAYPQIRTSILVIFPAPTPSFAL